MESDAASGTNRLAQETSLYLRQHMNNPVDWHPWGEEALALARKSDKPLLISIGYSACHWCHVMERESFEDPQTAERMNALFVCIKVDREERPDVDQLYMDTVVGLQGQGGWPLTVFCTPDGKPFYGGTYYPPEPRHGLPSFQQLLQSIDRVYREERDKVDATASQILEALRKRPQGVAKELPGPELLAGAARRLMQSADRNHGGFGTAPKFPTPTNLDLILAAQSHLPPDEAQDALEFLVFSCREMSRRGLYDQLGGGFHRYCVDAHWGVPHFEKMLYDQGQLLRVLADVWRRTGGSDDDLVWPILETAEYLRREMRGPQDGWFASQDADSEGEEGVFYAWTPSQVQKVLEPEAAARFCQTYAVTPTGNFEGRAVLWDLARGPRDDLRRERQQLYEARSTRVWPATDTKCVASWNALTVSGLAYAGSVLDRPELIADARSGADFLRTRLRGADGRWLRVWADDKARIPAFLDDMSALLAAFLDLHRAGAGDEWLPLALEVAEDLAARFFDPEEGDLFLTAADGDPLVQRPRSDHDGATPHSCGLAVQGLLRAASVSGRDALRKTAEQVIRTHAFALERSPMAYPTLLRASVWAQSACLALIVGDPAAPETRALALRARRVLTAEDAVLTLAPGSQPLGVDPSWLADRGPVGGRPAAYVCRGVSCSLPVTEPGELLIPPAAAATSL